MLGAFSGCTTVINDAPLSTSGPSEFDAGVIILSVAPLSAGAEHRQYPSDPLFNHGPSLDLFEDVGRGWKTNYVLFSQALVSAAEREKLDSASLAAILELARSPDRNPGLTVLPVAAHQTKLNGELVWVVALRWEIERLVNQGTGLGHIRWFTFTQKTLRQVDFRTCG